MLSLSHVQKTWSQAARHWGWWSASLCNHPQDLLELPHFQQALPPPPLGLEGRRPQEGAHVLRYPHLRGTHANYPPVLARGLRIRWCPVPREGGPGLPIPHLRGLSASVNYYCSAPLPHKAPTWGARNRGRVPAHPPYCWSGDESFLEPPLVGAAVVC